MIFHSYVSLPKGIIYDGLPKCLFLVLLINCYSLRAASYCAFQTMTGLNCLVVSSPLKPHISQLGLLFPNIWKNKSHVPNILTSHIMTFPATSISSRDFPATQCITTPCLWRRSRSGCRTCDRRPAFVPRSGAGR